MSSSGFRFSLGPLISWTFPNTAAARARIGQAQASAEAALATFDGTWLVALRDTETALTNYAALGRRVETLRRFAETFAPHGFDSRAIYPCYGMAETTLQATGPMRGEGYRTRKLSRSALQNNRIEAPRDRAGLLSGGGPNRIGDCAKRGRGRRGIARVAMISGRHVGTIPNSRGVAGAVIENNVSVEFIIGAATLS